MTEQTDDRMVNERTLPEREIKLPAALEDMRQQRDKALRYLDIVAHIIVSLDRDGRITMINKAGCRVLGYDEGDLMGRDWFSTCLPAGVGEEVRERFHRVMTGRKLLSDYYENAVITRDGEERCIAWHNTLLKDEHGGIVGTLSSGEDITDRKRAEAAVHESEVLLHEEQRKLSTLVSNLPGLVYRCRNDQNWTTEFVSDGVFRLTGYPASDFLEHRREVGSLIHADDREAVWNDVQAALREHRSYELSYRIICAKGRVRWVWEHGCGVYSPSGDLLALEGYVTEITARKQAEEAIRQQLAEITSYYDNAPIGMAVFDTELRYLRINARLAEMNGIPAADHLGKTVREIVPTLYEQARKVTDDILRTGRPVEEIEFQGETAAQPGVQRVWQEGWYPLRDDGGKITGFTVIVQEITERRRAELEKNKFVFLAENSHEFIGMCDMSFMPFYGNEAAMRMVGLDSLEQVRQTPVREFFFPEDQAFIFDEFFPRVMREGRGEVEIRFRHFQTGEPIWVNYNVFFLTDDRGAPVGLATVSHNITERKRAIEALRQSEERYRLLFERNLAGVFQSTLDGRSLDCNDAFIRMFGYSSKAELLSLSCTDLYPSTEDRKRFLCELRDKGELRNFEILLRRKDGSSFTAMENVALVHESGGNQFIQGTIVDITDRKNAEEQATRHQAVLAHVARVSTMGEMASGLAHELNQPLTAVVNYAQGALIRLQSTPNVHPEVIEAIKNSSNQAHRAAEIIRRLANFVQKQGPRRSGCNLNEAIREVLNFTAADVRNLGIIIHLDLAVNLPTVQADNIQIQQVILNLIRNGIEAMNETKAGERILQIQTSATDDAVEVAVGDRGPGIPPQAQERLFEPFFTTKPKGMGMGLSISRSIIDSHGGRLWATPNPERGTTFHFTLPMTVQGSGR